MTADPAEVREWLRRFWHEVLSVQLPLTANPMDAGATSISVVRMIAEIEDRWDVILPAHVLMRCAPLAEIERLVTARGERTEPAPGTVGTPTAASDIRSAHPPPTIMNITSDIAAEDESDAGR